MQGEVPPTAGLPLQLTDLWSSQRPRLADSLATFIGVPELQIECSGTAALFVALRALREMSIRRTVIIPAFTCPLVPIAIAHCGLRVQLCDVAPSSFDFDRAHLETLCDHNTLAVIPTHLAGRVADVHAAMDCAADVGAWVIEDGAQALGARSGAASVGTLGDIGFFSLATGKGLSIYEGGVLFARDPRIRVVMRRVSDNLIGVDRCREWWRSLQLAGYAMLYRPRLLRWIYGLPLRRALRRGDAVTAAGDHARLEIPLHRVGAWRQRVGARALTRLRAFQAGLTMRAASRVERLQAIAGVAVLGDPADAVGTWPVIVVCLPSRRARDAALAKLWPAGLGVGVVFAHALPEYGFLDSIVSPVAVPNAQALASLTLTISNSPWLDDARFDRIVTDLAHALAES